MRKTNKNPGFTLTEVLIATGILAVGFVIIAGAFSVGVKLTKTATERTIGATVAQEALAKIQLYGIDMSRWYSEYVNYIPFPEPPEPIVETTTGITHGRCFDYSKLALLDWPTILGVDQKPALPYNDDDIDDDIDDDEDYEDDDEYYYPSTNLVEVGDKKYHWSAICRRVNNEEVQATIFVSRLAVANEKFPVNPIPLGDEVDESNLDPDYLVDPQVVVDHPEPYMIKNLIYDPQDPDDPSDDIKSRQVIYPETTPDGVEGADFSTYFRVGSTILQEHSGYLYTIISIDTENNIIELDRNWRLNYRKIADNPPQYEPILDNYNVWVLPSPIKDSNPTGSTVPRLGGRWPCVWVFQDIIKLNDFNAYLEVPVP